ncbi:MAG: glycosyltransferase family 2 protein [Candidatus Omnitrophica bacterium]|nr:glycosyltransferase family 2 protein [Candidatus Omnitrophota bacterium]
MKGLSIVVPCYNEEKSVVKTIEDLTSTISKLRINFEIIAVDDHSSDKSLELLQDCKGPLSIISNDIQLGYGGALKRGIAKAKHDAVLIIDADGTYSCDSIPQLIQTFEKEGLDMVVGSRTKKDSQISRSRKFGKWFIVKLATYLSGRHIPDLNSGLRIMKKEVIDKFIHILPNGFSFTTTITLAMLTNNHFVKYIPIDYLKRTGRSKIRPFKDTSNFFLLVARTIMYFDPLKIFLPLSAVLFFVGLILILIRIFVRPMLISTTIITFVAGFMILSLGLLADLIDKRTK